MESKLALFFLGLTLYVVNLGLHVSIGISYAALRDCHRSIHIQKTNFSLDQIVNDIEILDRPEGQSWVKSTLDSSSLIKVHNQLVQLLPEHWRSQLSSIVDFQLSRYRASSISEKCLFNGKRYKSIFDLSINLMCQKGLSDEHRALLRNVLEDVDKQEEDAIISALINGDTVEAVANLSIALDLNLSQDVFNVFKRFTSKLSNNEKVQLAKLLNDEYMQNRLPALLSTMNDVDPSDISSLSKTFGRIEADNLPKVDALMRKLNVTLVQFVSDPSLFVKFYRNEELSKVLLQVQALLPQFEPEELNAVVKIKNIFEERIEAQEALQRLMQLPLELLLKLVENAPNKDEMVALRRLGVVARSEEVQNLLNLAKQLDLMSEEGRYRFLKTCDIDKLDVKCEDEEVDLCSNGHITFVLMVCLALATPGLVVAVSEFWANKAFSIVPFSNEDNDENLVGAKWPMVLKLMVLPIYILAMIVLVPCYVILNYIRLVLGKRKETEWPKLLEQTMLLQHMVAMLNGFPQMVINAAALLLLVNLNAGSVLAGITVQQYFSSLFPLTVASLILGLLHALFTSWQVHALDSSSKSHIWPNSSLPIFALWQISTRISQICVTLLLIFVMWMEIFSNVLTSQTLFDVHLIVPLAMFSILPINVIMHYKYLEGQLCLGVASAIFPTRFLHKENKKFTEHFLGFNQLSFVLVPTFTFLLYALLLLLMHLETLGLLKLVPIVAAISSIGPLVGLIYFRMTLDPRKAKEETEESEDNEEDEEEPILITLWKLFSILVRLLSLALLIVVFSIHFLNFGSAKGVFVVHLSLFVIFLLLLLLLNVALHYSLISSPSLLMALVSSLVANSFHLIEKLDLAALYLVLNLILNLFLHLLAYIVLAFFCWPCTKQLSLDRLMIALPIVVVLWVVHAFFSLYVWNGCIRPKLEIRLKQGNDANQENKGDKDT